MRKLLSDPSDDEAIRFAAWKANHAETVIHTDSMIYQQYQINTFSEFDLFHNRDSALAGYNAYLNNLCGLSQSKTDYHLAFNLFEKIDPDKIVHSQNHHTPLYTVEALRYRQAVIECNGENHVYYAGAWLGDGLHEGAISSAITVARLLNVDTSIFD